MTSVIVDWQSLKSFIGMRVTSIIFSIITRPTTGTSTS